MLPRPGTERPIPRPAGGPGRAPGRWSGARPPTGLQCAFRDRLTNRGLLTSPPGDVCARAAAGSRPGQPASPLALTHTWTFLTDHAHVLLVVRQSPTARPADIGRRSASLRGGCS